MPKLNLPDANLKIKLVKEDTQVFDKVRKKYFQLTSEEWVRQHFIHYLNNYKKYPLGLMRVERLVKYNGMQTRADIILYDLQGQANIIVECKSPNLEINQSAFSQIAKYNYQLKANFLIVTNGMKHFCCKMDYKNSSIQFLEDIPSYTL